MLQTTPTNGPTPTASPPDSGSDRTRGMMRIQAVTPDLRRAGAWTLAASTALICLLVFGRPQSPIVGERVLSYAGTAFFAVLAVLAVRGAARQIADVVGARGGSATSATVHLVLTATGYLIVGSLVLTLADVPIQRLLLSGAVTAVILGVAAQQSLSNTFAGFMLLFTRPFDVGQHIMLRSGALGGDYAGEVVSIGLTYTVLATDDGTFTLPNAAVLAAASGPRPASDQPDADHNPTTGATPGCPRGCAPVPTGAARER